MTYDINAADILATLIFLGVLGSSAYLWMQYIQRPPHHLIPDAGAPAWPIGWTNFGIFICAEVIVVGLVQFLGAILLRDTLELSDGELTPWLAVAAVLLLQLPLITVLYALRRFFPGIFASRMNTSSYSLGATLRETTLLFLRYMPVIWIISFVWTQLLSLMHVIGFIDEFEPQALITLFQSGGHPVAIGLLIIFAVILAPIVEELIFRGCIYRFLKSRMAFPAAQVISGSIFALMHANLLSFVPLVAVGILLARIYEKAGNLIVAICFHAFFNGFSLMMLYLASHSNVLAN